MQHSLTKGGGYVVCCNVHILTASQRIPSLREALRAAWLVVPDGAPVAWLQRRTGASRARRIPGPDLMLAVVARGQTTGVKHFLFGSTPTVLDSLEQRLEQTAPSARIVGAYSPRPGEEDSPEALSSIISAQPDIVWVGLGAPRQELWMHRHTDDLDALALGVGAAFDFHAGAKQRAPKWVQETGFEWLHRLVSEPLRLGPRYLRTNPSFVRIAARELLHRHRGERCREVDEA